MPDWLCLEDECEFEKDPVKVIGLYSLFLLAKSLLHAPLFCLLSIAVAMLKKKTLQPWCTRWDIFMVYLLFLNTGQAFPSAPSPKGRKKWNKHPKTSIQAEISKMSKTSDKFWLEFCFGLFFFSFPYVDVANV